MNFDLTADQKMLVDTASSFAKKESPVERHRKLRDDALGWDKKVWRHMGELGWLGVAFPEEVGGFGGGAVEVALLMEQFGKTLVPEPFIESVVLAGMTLAKLGNAAQHTAWLTPMIEGETSLALAALERDSRFDVGAVATTARADGAGYVLSGEKTWVQNGHAADVLLVSARTSGGARDRAGITLFAVLPGDAGVTIVPTKTVDGRHAATLRLDSVALGADRVVGTVGAAAEALDEAFDRAAAAGCAEGVGIAAAVLAMTVDYLKTREQFDTKIGAFQALQHRAVDMFIETELCRSMAILAAIRADSGDALERQEAISAAMVQLSQGGRLVVRQGIQLHGGIGCTDEHDIGLYFKRMQALGVRHGDETYHLDRFAKLPSFAVDADGGQAS